MWVIALYYDAQAEPLPPVWCLPVWCHFAVIGLYTGAWMHHREEWHGGREAERERPQTHHRHSKMSGTPSATTQSAKMRKDESFLGKLGGTLVRKKKSKEGKTLFLFFLLLLHHEWPPFVSLVFLSMVLWSHDALLEYSHLGHHCHFNHELIYTRFTCTLYGFIFDLIF